MTTKTNTVTKADINSAMAEIVNAFLRWPLPESVCSDRCATMSGTKHRSGTNLLTCPETVGMVQEVVRPVVTALLNSETARLEALAAKMKRFVAENYPPAENGQVDFVRLLVEGYADEMLPHQALKAKLDALSPAVKGWLHRACNQIADAGEYIPNETARAAVIAAGLAVLHERDDSLEMAEGVMQVVYSDGYLSDFATA